MEDVNPLDAKTVNEGLKERYSRTRDGKRLDMILPLKADILNMNKLLLNDIGFTVKLYPSKPAFNLMSSASVAHIYNINVQSAALRVCRVIVSPELSDAHRSLLNSGSSAKYPLQRSENKTFVIQKGHLHCQMFSRTEYPIVCL